MFSEIVGKLYSAHWQNKKGEHLLLVWLRNDDEVFLWHSRDNWEPNLVKDGRCWTLALNDDEQAWLSMAWQSMKESKESEERL